MWLKPLGGFFCILQPLFERIMQSLEKILSIAAAVAAIVSAIIMSKQLVDSVNASSSQNPVPCLVVDVRDR